MLQIYGIILKPQNDAGVKKQFDRKNLVLRCICSGNDNCFAI